MQTPDQDIIDLNLAWLITARQMTLSDRDKAAIVLGLDEVEMAWLSQVSLDELFAIARAGIMVLHPRFQPGFWHDPIGDGQELSPATLLHSLLIAAEEASGE